MRKITKTAVAVAAGVALAVGLVAVEPSQAGPAMTTYDVTLKGVSATTAGDKFKFTGDGTMSIDPVGGAFSYSVALSNGLTFAATGGNAATTNKNKLFGLAQVDSNGVQGSVIFEGKLKGGGSKFAGKLTAALPNRLGAPPDGFVMTKMKIKGTEQQPVAK